jgi:hypothetical protein
MRTIIPIVVALAGASLVCVPALAADSRSVVLERAAHCDILPAGRAWLDCFYGAAQPMRQFLGLVAAPQAAQYQQVYAQRAGSSLAASPDIRAAVLDRAAHCGILPEGGAWLDCFYGAAQPARQALGLSPAPQSVQLQQVYAKPLSQGGPAVTNKEDDSPNIFDMFNSPKVPPERFGFKGAKPGHGLNVDRIVDRVANLQGTNTGFVVTLANGQVWKQVDTAPAYWRARGAGYTVIITHGAFNSFNMRRQLGKDAETETYKVERVR